MALNLDDFLTRASCCPYTVIAILTNLISVGFYTVISRKFLEADVIPHTESRSQCKLRKKFFLSCSVSVYVGCSRLRGDVSVVGWFDDVKRPLLKSSVLPNPTSNREELPLKSLYDKRRSMEAYVQSLNLSYRFIRNILLYVTNYWHQRLRVRPQQMTWIEGTSLPQWYNTIQCNTNFIFIVNFPWGLFRRQW